MNDKTELDQHKATLDRMAKKGLALSIDENNNVSEVRIGVRVKYTPAMEDFAIAAPGVPMRFVKQWHVADQAQDVPIHLLAEAQRRPNEWVDAEGVR